MGRPRKWTSDAERKAAKRCPDTLSGPDKRTDQAVNGQNKRTESDTASKRTPDDCESKRTGIDWHPEISQDRFKGVGRGVPVNGYVLISLRSEPNGNTEQAVVSEQTWRERLDKVCAHSLAGWACKICLNETSNTDS